MNKNTKKYTVWGIIMIVMGVLTALLGAIFMAVCFTGIMTELNTMDYQQIMSQVDSEFSQHELEIMMIFYLLCFCVYLVVEVFVQIHGGIKMIKKQSKGTAWFIVYGIEAILSAVFLGFLTLCFWMALAIVQAAGEQDVQVSGVIVVFVLLGFFAIATAYKIVSACLLFSKMKYINQAKRMNCPACAPASSDEVAVQPCEQQEVIKEGSVLIQSGEYENHSFSVKDGDEVAIGSDATKSNLTLHDDRISAKHCVIRYHAKDDMFHLTDVSETGTIINGVPIDKNITYALPKGSVVLLGNAVQFTTK